MNNSEIFLDTSALIPLLTPEHKNHKIVRRFVSGFKVFCIDSVVLSEYLAGISRGGYAKMCRCHKKTISNMLINAQRKPYCGSNIQNL